MISRSTIRVALILSVIGLTGCARSCANKPTAPAPEVTEFADSRPVVTPNYAGITVTKVVKREMGVGEGREAQDGDTVLVKYTEWVYDPAALANQGPKISDSADGLQAIKIGGGKFIRGFEEGLKGMKKGGKRQLIIPAAEAYGDAGRPPQVPPKAMVMIDVELMAIE